MAEKQGFLKRLFGGGCSCGLTIIEDEEQKAKTCCEVKTTKQPKEKACCSCQEKNNAD